MADATNKLLYIVVVDREEEEKRDGDRKLSRSSSSSSLTFRYTRSLLQSTFQFMGCKAGHAFKISRRVFEMMRSECSASTAHHMVTETLEPVTMGRSSKENNCNVNCVVQQEGPLTLENFERNNSRLFDLYKRLTTVFVLRENFLNVVCHALSQYKYVGPNQRADFALACRLREKKESVTILLCGTSGCGKSTLSALLGSRLGITTVISTDSIRHMMRSFVDETQNPLLWSSTYHAGDHLDPVAVTEAKARRKANKLAGVSHLELSDRISNLKSKNEVPERFLNKELVGQRQMAIEGFKAQSEMVIDSLDRLITAWEERKESVIVEGVHLSLNFVMGLMKKHPSIIPFMIYISNEDKHMERFAVRAKYMTLEPSKNRYVKYIRNIRAIQDYLCNRADKYLVPKINNTNVDKSVAAIHATVFSCLRKRWAGEQLYDPTTNTIPLVNEAYRNQLSANSLSSKGMFQLIQSKGSSRNLMALLNSDGSVAKAWNVESGQVILNSIIDTESDESIGTSMYGSFQIRKAEPVNLQFGNFGISAWSRETCGTSQTGSVDELRPDGTDTASKCFSSCCSSPKMSDGLSKEVKEGSSVSGSDEEAEDARDADSDEDASDLDNTKIHEEMEGSVDEDSAKSDEEYENLVMQDGLDNGYCSDCDEPYREKKLTEATAAAAADMDQNGERESMDKYQQNLNVFPTVRGQHSESPPSYFSSVLSGKNSKNEERIKRRLAADSSRLHARSWSFPTAFNMEEAILTDAILSGAPRK